MKANTSSVALAVFLLLLLGSSVIGVSEDRKLKVKVTPTYPELAKRMQVSGVVKLELTIEPNGSVSKIKPVGGHPLLIEAATQAARSYRFEPAGESSTQVIEFKFNNGQ